MREGMRERNGMREKPDCQDLQTHLEEGRRDCWKKDMVEEREGREWNGNEEMKRDLREERPSNTSDGREVREL